MHRFIFAVALMALLVAGAVAQSLEAADVTDTFDSGSRGNLTGTGPTFNNSLLDGSEFADVSPVDGVGVTGGTIRYINTWAGATATEVETPVVDFTAAHDNQDRTLVGAIAAIAANTNDSVSPNNGVIVGDDGGFNALIAGDTSDENYYFQADVYCYDRTAAPAEYEVYGIFARGARDNTPEDVETGGYSYDRQGSYALMWDANLGIVSARRWEANWTGGTALTAGQIVARDAGTFTEFAQDAITGDAWHTLRIECVGDQITFIVDGSELISVTDSTYAAGRAGLGYRESAVASASETQGHFDNLKAGPLQLPWGPPFSLVGTFSTNHAPLPIAADAAGGLYYATFDAASSSVYYLADPVAEIGDTDPSDHALIATVGSFAAGRGFQGIGVNASGEVFASGDNGTGGELLKYGAAPGFAPDATFNGNAAAAFAASRHAGLALLGSNSIAVTRFNSLAYVDQGAGTLIRALGGGTNYQREAVYNPVDEVIYAMRNGASTSEILTGYYGGSTAAEASYEWTAAASLLPDGAVNTAFGIATQHGFIDVTQSPPKLYTIDTAVDPEIRAWDIDSGGASLTFDGSITSATGGAGWASVNDCVRIGNYLYVTGTNDDTIYVYQPTSTTSVEGFELYR